MSAAAGGGAGEGEFPTLVSPQWLKDNMSKVKVLNATW